jgi:hypothetical protein
MLNEYKRQALEERLQILDIIEMLITRAPDRSHYEEMLSDFGLSISPDGMMGHLDEIAKLNVARFTLPSGLSRWTFWDARVRISNVDPVRLQVIQQSLRDELTDSRLARSAAGISDKGGGGGERLTDSAQNPTPSTESRPLPIFVGILGLIATVVTIVVTVGSWQLLKNDFVRTIAVIGLILLAVVLTRLTLRLKAGELPRRVTLDMAIVGILCVCGTLVLTTVLNRQAVTVAGRGTSSSPIPASTNLEFELTDGSKVPWCQVYNGTGSIPAGYQLIIFDTPAGPDGEPASPAYYSLDAIAIHPVAGHWYTIPVQIGSPGVANFYSDIVGVLASESTYDYIKSIIIYGNAPWWTTKLPPGPKISLFVVTNGKRGIPCHAAPVK